jgi:hypothetical protein
MTQNEKNSPTMMKNPTPSKANCSVCVGPLSLRQARPLLRLLTKFYFLFSIFFAHLNKSRFEHCSSIRILNNNLTKDEPFKQIKKKILKKDAKKTFRTLSRAAYLVIALTVG